MEDEVGLRQDIEMTVDLDVDTPTLDAKQVVTNVTLDCLELVLPTAPGIDVIISTIEDNLPLLRAMHFKITIGAGSPTERPFFFQQKPQPYSYASKKTSTNEFSYGGSVVASATPAVQLTLMKKNGMATESVPLSDVLNLKQLCINKDGGTGDHVWSYPLRTDRDVTTVSLVPHTSRAKYSCTEPLTSLKTTLEALFEIKPCVRTSNVFRKTNRSRVEKRALSIGYKHLSMRFSVEVKRKDNSTYLQLRGQDAIGSTTRLHHKLPMRCAQKEIGLSKEATCEDNLLAPISVASVVTP